MRALSLFERQLVEKMIEIGKMPEELINPINILDPFLENVQISLDLKAETGQILFELPEPPKANNGEQQENLRRLGDVIRIIVSYVNLIQYLEKEGYLMLYKRFEFPAVPIVFGKGVIGSSSAYYPIHDTAIVKLLIQLVQKDVILTEALVQYVNAGYSTPEEQRHKQNMRWTKIGIALAFFVGVFPSYVALRDDKKMNEGQFGVIRREYDSLNVSLHAIGTKLDTLTNKPKVKTIAVAPNAMPGKKK